VAEEVGDKRDLRDRFGARLREVRLFGSFARGLAEHFDAEAVALIARAATHRDLADYERNWHATEALFTKSPAELHFWKR
jgi:predicted nucleotidyltransferase